MDVPNLTPEIMSDHDALSDMINKLLLASKKMGKLTKRVVRAQDRLHRVVGRRAWAKYMMLEEVVNERAGHEMDVIIRWAFDAGRRHGIALGVRLVSCQGNMIDEDLAP